MHGCIGGELFAFVGSLGRGCSTFFSRCRTFDLPPLSYAVIFGWIFVFFSFYIYVHSILWGWHGI